MIGRTIRPHALARLALSVVLAGTFGSCGGEIDPTEVVVIVTGDFAVPGELDRVLIQVTPPAGDTQMAEADLTTAGFPRSLGIHNPDGPLGPYIVEAIGFSGITIVARRRAVFDFTRDESLEIELPLLTDCIGATCLCTDVFCSTCVEGGTCASASVDPEPFDGVGRHLAGAFELDL